MATSPALPDHLVVAATTLAEGIEYVGDLTGSVPRPGGRHVAMGTHNALLRLGERFYLEIIAIDPEGTKPARPRWFDLDHPSLVAALAEGPRLIHWVARSDDIERTARGLPDRARARSTRWRAATTAGASRFPTTARAPAAAWCRR